MLAVWGSVLQLTAACSFSTFYITHVRDGYRPLRDKLSHTNLCFHALFLSFMLLLFDHVG